MTFSPFFTFLPLLHIILHNFCQFLQQHQNCFCTLKLSHQCFQICHNNQFEKWQHVTGLVRLPHIIIYQHFWSTRAHFLNHYVSPSSVYLSVRIYIGLSVCISNFRSELGALQRKKIQKIRDYYGSGWVGPGLTRNFCLLENRPKIALNQYWYFGVVYHVYSVCICIAKSCWLLWFACSVHVSDGFPTKKTRLDWGCVGGVSSIQFLFDFFEFF